MNSLINVLLRVVLGVGRSDDDRVSLLGTSRERRTRSNVAADDSLPRPGTTRSFVAFLDSGGPSCVPLRICPGAHGLYSASGQAPVFCILLAHHHLSSGY